ncbi:peptidylprolyl isomerase [Candidatus Enterovibrio escicola]|uniref:Peptidyl-prolyl cis-trans isomerase n=1 Tax=Candidatus Enterovibrio escicola TaxID=1927127 RepID=A0A2A5T3A9_9GAMM|nr:peptidylprolyl isomerase [Candidatus Enterovibrio escacola]PCS22631.1 Peptidyl-prolyl cis-trans isomerase PpiB [Candidatus Enterovibrio escacola]
MVIFCTNFGVVKIKLNTEKAPKTSINFLQYCQDGFYNGTIFHRVINGFMIQGGSLTYRMEEKEPRASIKNEANNGLSNKTGTLAMARTLDPHSASSQFFINVNDNTFLDFKSESMDGWGYCVFAEIAEGMDIVNNIKSVQTAKWGYVHQHVPVEKVLIDNVTIEE